MKLFNTQKLLYVENVWLLTTLPMLFAYGIWAVMFATSAPPQQPIKTYEVMPQEMFACYIDEQAREKLGSYVISSTLPLNVEVIRLKNLKKVFSQQGKEIHLELLGDGVYLVTYTIKIDGKIYTTTRKKRIVRDDCVTA